MFWYELTIRSALLICFAVVISAVKECQRPVQFIVVKDPNKSANGFTDIQVKSVNQCAQECYTNAFCTSAIFLPNGERSLCTLSYANVETCASAPLETNPTFPDGKAVLLTCISCPTNGVEDNVVVKWNRLAQRTAARMNLQPPESTRWYALFHTAIRRSFLLSFNQKSPAICQLRDEIYIAGAAHTVTVGQFPPMREAADELMRETMRKDDCPHDLREEYYQQSLQAAADTIAERAKDKCPCFADYKLKSEKFDDWIPPQGVKPNPVLPCWGNVTMWNGATKVDEFVPGPPPTDPSTDDFKAFWDELYNIGERNSTVRTQHQSEVAVLWHPAVFVGQLNTIVIDVLKQNVPKDDLKSYVNTFWLTAIADADAATVVWRTKYIYNNWRPITAFRKGIEKSRHLATLQNWESLLDTPVFPDYPSGHSAMGQAVITVLTGLYGDKQSFSVTDGKITHYFTSLKSAALDNAYSRIYGGVHWRYSCDASIKIGEKVAQAVLASKLQELKY